MPHEKIYNNFTGGLDTDSQENFVKPTDWRYALNIRAGVAYANREGAITNLKGNTEVAYALPSGTNTCIGAYEDKQENTVIYFIANENGNNKKGLILRYFPERGLNGAIDLQLEYDFGWTATTEITGIELINKRLLYWNDPKPRKINIEKARYILPDGTQKVKEWSLVLPKTISNLTAPYELYFKDENGTLIFGVLYDPASYTTREEFIQAIATNLNLVSSQSPVTAEACDCSLNFTEKVGGTVWIIESNNPTIVIPTNWYGLTITDRMVDRAKYPPLYDPIGEYQQDDNYLYNYVKNKVFQFRLQYRYDDFENSALGVISQIPIDNLQCDGTNNPDKNYIDVDFNDPALLDQLTYSILTNVKVLAREQNDGNWKEIIQLSPCEFLDYDGTNWVASYNFYNDIVSNTVPDTEVAKQYDDVPLSAEENILVKNRSILANVVKGYDAPDCIPATWDVDVADDPNIETYKVTGLIRIANFFLDNNGTLTPRNTAPNILERRSAVIFNQALDADYSYYGGVMYDGGSVTVYDEAYSNFKQILPEGGFTVYLAGTNYKAISKQKNITIGDLNQLQNGAIDVTAGKTDLQNFYQDGTNEVNSGNPIGDYDVYSTFEIPNIPNGTYVLRFASPQCSFDDKLGLGFMYDLRNGTAYQRTSAPIWGFNVFDANTGTYTWTEHYEVTFTVNGADVFIGEAVIADYTYYSPTSSSFDFMWATEGYMLDALGDSTASILRNEGTIVEKTYIENVYQNLVSPLFQFAGVGQPDKRPAVTTVTDHNGFFYLFAGELLTGGAQVKYTANQVGGNMRKTALQQLSGADVTYLSQTKSPLQDLQENVLVQSAAGGNGLRRIILPTTVNRRNDSSTFIEGQIIDQNGVGVANGVIIYENGRVVSTDSNGDYSILAWGDMWYLYDLGINENKRVDDRLVVSIDELCRAAYPSGQFIPITIDPFSGTYSPTNKYLVADFSITDLLTPYIKAHKRGGKYTYGIRYYDENGRFCSVVKAFEMYLPFITQDLNVLCIQDNYDLPNQYPVGTFKYGKPTINWHIAASQNAPEWAYYYQWMRTKNSIYGRYLQWVVNDVTYLNGIATDTIPETQTSYQNGDAVAVKLGIGNIVDYQVENGNSQVGYTFQQGDRVRVIASRSYSYLSTVIDLEVLSYDNTTQTITAKLDTNYPQILSGSYIEIMNPLTISDNEEQIYYEVGEVYACTAPNSGNNQHSVLNGFFTNGDTYWRGRFITVNDDQDNYTAAYPIVIEDASVSDFYPSNSQDIGRAGVVDPNFKQIHYPTMMQNSGIYVEGSALNGLSSFNTYDYKELNRAFGSIKRLFYVGNTLISIHENKVVANYIELRSLSDANTTDGLLAVSDAYFGNDRPMQSEYGCQHGKSAVQWNGLVYFLDAAKGVVCRYDNNGMDAISDKSMRSYFRDLCRDGVNKVRAVFDPYYRQYVVTIDAENGTKTIAWDEEKNRWTSEYSFIGEDYASVLRSIVSFKDGKLWLHDSNPIYNNFYGVQYSSQVKNVVVSGTNRSTYHTLTLQAVQADPLQNDWQALNITNEFNQLSRIKKPHFRLKENVWAASFLRDTTDTTVSNPIINGRNLRSQTLTILFDNDSTDAVYLQTVTTKVLPSERQ